MRAISPALGLLATVFLLTPTASEAAPTHMPAPTDRPQARPTKPVEIKKFATIEAKNAAAMPGETRNVEATLKAGQNPIAGKRVYFRFEGKGDGPSASFNIGSAVTNAQGKATVAWKVPELAQAAYALKARFAGDDDTGAASDEANFAVFKAATEFDVDYNYGAIDSHGGPHYGTLLIALRRQSDDKALTKTFKVTVNAGESTEAIKDYTATSGFVTVVLPTQTNTWKVKIQFFGDAANQATQHEKTYSH